MLLLPLDLRTPAHSPHHPISVDASVSCVKLALPKESHRVSGLVFLTFEVVREYMRSIGKKQ